MAIILQRILRGSRKVGGFHSIWYTALVLCDGPACTLPTRDRNAAYRAAHRLHG